MSLLGLAACGRDPQARADTTESRSASSYSGTSWRDSVAGYVVDTPPPQGTPVRKDTAKPAKDSAAADSTRSAKDSLAAKDSAKAPALSVKMAPGRPRRDSLALIYALRAANKHPGWPVKGPAPAEGVMLPQTRIIAFYGNPLSKRMGILGELPPDQMLAKLDTVVREWEAADPDTPVQPALHFIAVVAQGAPGKDGKYRLRMDSSLIEQVYGWAEKRNALLFLDIQAGFSTVAEELPRLMKFLERPNVHLGIDPEFYMHYDREGIPPGKKIGTLSSKDINHAIAQLAELTSKKGIPPKVLVIHRFTRPMVRGASQIKLDPRVQVVMHMDGWGAPWLKFDSYKDYVIDEPVQFTGFKLFYKNDTKKGDKLLTAGELVQLKPRPVYIQYQ
ncbi:MAG: hypothetical protein WD825_04270 [Gemmatimonadaceae bacterium]